MPHDRVVMRIKCSIIGRSCHSCQRTCCCCGHQAPGKLDLKQNCFWTFLLDPYPNSERGHPLPYCSRTPRFSSIDRKQICQLSHFRDIAICWPLKSVSTLASDNRCQIKHLEMCSYYLFSLIYYMSLSVHVVPNSGCA